MRVRQRGRGGLRAFDPDLQPVLSEVGIDRFSMSVVGHWNAERTTHSGLSVEQYFETLTPGDDPQWFRMETTRTGVAIKSRAAAATTLGPINLSVERQRERGGFIKFSLNGGNVTRTLHHLLIMHGHEGQQFVEVVSRLDPASFFSRASGGVPLGFGQDPDNWISDYAVMRACLGDNPFDAFHPIYVRQLQKLVAWLVLPVYNSRVIDDATSLVSLVPGIVCRMNWGDVRLKQIEAYFERRHSYAIGAVRLLATAALVDFDDADVWRYLTNTSVWAGRADDNLSVGFDLRKGYRLSVYAKAPGRIRFEVRRKGTGTTIASSDGTPMPEKRLLDMFRNDRTNLLDAARWPMIGPLMDEHPAPQMNDLVRLCSAVQRVSGEHRTDFTTLMSVLLQDGGLRPNGAHGWTDALIDDLRRAGVLHRPTVRRRDHRRPNKRYALRPEYRGLINLISRSLLEGRGLFAERP